MKVNHCKINHILNPLGYHLDSIRVSWIIEECHGKKQDWARIHVSLSEDMSQLVFDTGIDPTLSNLSTLIDMEIKARTRYFYTIEVMADNGESAFSEVHWFETGKMEEPWTAKWIGTHILETENPIFRKKFTLDAKVKKARAYVCGLGLYELYIDKKKVGDEFFAPYSNNYAEWIQYQTYALDLSKGEHEITLSIGNGWYKGKFGLNLKENIYGDQHKLLVEIHVEYENRDVDIIKTDDLWEVSCGDIEFNNFYDGEIYRPRLKERKWENVQVLKDGFEKLMARLSLPVIIKERRLVKEIIKTPAGETVLDLGQNMVGFVEFINRIPAGNQVRLQYGEILQNGNFYRDNLRAAKAEYIFVSDGKERKIRPSFTYFGFRYVKLEGFGEKINITDFEGCVLYSDIESVGSISTDNKKVNQLIQNAMWGQKGNYVDVPTDCPQRDERMGWTGDTQVFTPTACYLMDSYAFLNKFMFDLKMTQKQLGVVTNVIPAFDEKNLASSGWGDATTIIPWVLYEFYGDKWILEQQFESMKSWVDSIRKIDLEDGNQHLWRGSFHFGDWLGQDNEDVNERFKGGTEDDYIASAYYFYSSSIVAKAAEVLGRTKEAMEYKQLADEIKGAIGREYFTPNGRLAIQTQTAYILALYMEFYPDGAKERMIFGLKQKFKMSKGYLKTGFIGTAYICKTLSDIGANDLAYGLLLNEESPSWLYAVNLGATTIWERWNSLLPDGTINGTDMNSFNHYSYGSIVEWMFRNMAGLKPNSKNPGFKNIVIQPQPDQKIRELDASYLSASGLYECHWKIKDNGYFYLSIRIPFDATATLILPASDLPELYLTAGTYEYDYEPTYSFLERFGVDQSIESLSNNAKAKAIMLQYFPQWVQIPSQYQEQSLYDVGSSTYFGLSEATLSKIDQLLKEI